MASSVTLPQTFERRGTTVPLTVESFAHTRVRENRNGRERLLEAVIPNYHGVRRGEFTVASWHDLRGMASFSERDRFIMDKVARTTNEKQLDPIAVRLMVQQADTIHNPDTEIRRLAREQAQRDREEKEAVRMSCIAQLTRECGIARGDAFMAKADSRTLLDLMTGPKAQSAFDIEMLIERVMQFAAERSGTTIEQVRDWMEPLVGLIAPFGTIKSDQEERADGFLFRNHARLIEFRRAIGGAEQTARAEVAASIRLILDSSDLTIKYVNERIVLLDQLLGNFADMFEVFDNSVMRLQKLRRDIAYALDGWPDLIDHWDDAMDGRHLIGGEFAVERAIEHIVMFLPIMPERELRNSAVEGRDRDMEKRRMSLVQELHSWFTNELDDDMRTRVSRGRQKMEQEKDRWT